MRCIDRFFHEASVLFESVDFGSAKCEVIIVRLSWQIWFFLHINANQLKNSSEIESRIIEGEVKMKNEQNCFLIAWNIYNFLYRGNIIKEIVKQYFSICFNDKKQIILFILQSYFSFLYIIHQQLQMNYNSYKCKYT